MNLTERFQEYWKENFNHFSKCKFILAVSGGIDSTVLTDLFFNAGFDFAIAHCNFQLRGEESERDEAFVKSLAEKYNKEIFIKRFETKKYAGEKKISVQEAARELRYDWFKEIVNRQSSNVNDAIHHSSFTFHYICTAHNADDNIETSLMFFLRGSGIHGLTGIKEIDKERKIIRPLLFATRNEIVLYAKENNITWVEDSSNLTDKYTRNFLRNQLIPSVEKFFPEVRNNITANIHRFKEAAELYNFSIQHYKKKLLEYKGSEVHIPVLKLKRTQPLNTIIWEIIKEYNFHAHQVEEVKKLFHADNSSFIQSSTHRIIKNRNWLIIAYNKSEESEHILIEERDKIINFKRGCLTIEKLEAAGYKLQTAPNVAQLDATKIEFPLLLRRWKQGDYFYPLGMLNLPAGRQGKKKLSRFFIDKKLSATEKENIWVVESDKKILWVIGYRIDERFKITSSTKSILKITIT